MMTRHTQLRWLLAGDSLAILMVTMIGFLTHYGAIQNWHWLTTFLPVLAAWLFIAPWLGVYRGETRCQVRQVWRPALAALLSAPLAATFRGLWLDAAVPPIFVVVLGLTNALGLLLWRLIWSLFVLRVNRQANRQAGLENG